MTRIRHVFLAVAALVLAAAWAGGAANADSVSPAEQDTIRGMISSQIQAFQHDDGSAAWSYASPTIQQTFPTPEAFMAMVKNGYAPVYRPQSVTFGAFEADSPLGPIQKVYLTGPDGQPYVAVYFLQKQPDGTWKINGCSILKDDSPTI